MPRRYPTPWRQILALTPHVAQGSAAPMDRLCSEIAARLDPVPEIFGVERLPDSPRFVLVANHYQRRGLWIAHPASVLTETIGRRYGLDNPPVRWVVTANWPRWRLDRWTLPSPGDWLLPRVAAALGCYAVPFAGSNPAAAARGLRRLVRDARTLERPIGLFPEGVAGTAGRLADPLPGVDRLIGILAREGFAATPVAISETGSTTVRGALVLEFGWPVAADELAMSAAPAVLLMDRIRALLAPRRELSRNTAAEQ